MSKLTLKSLEKRIKALEKLKYTAPKTPTFKRDMRKEEGWKLVEDCGRDPALTIDTIPRLLHIPFLKKNEDWIAGEEVVVRARGELAANWGQQDAEFLLEHQHLIPVSYRDKYILFTGTIWQRRDGHRIVACLNWRGSKWYLRFDWLGAGYDSDDALPGLRK